MSNPESVGLFRRAQREARLCAVAMDDVQFLAFHQSGLSAIGTEGLSGCSVVIITSQFGAILAHIPPRPSMANSQDLHAGDRNVQAVMSRVATLYTHRKQYFSSPDTFVVCAIYAGAVALPEQKGIIESNITQMGLSTSNMFYEVPTDHANPGQGTVLIDSKDRAGQKPAVYVEDRLMSGLVQQAQAQSSTQQPSVQHQAQPSTSSTQQQAQSSTSEWVFDQTYRKYRRLVDNKWEWAP